VLLISFIAQPIRGVVACVIGSIALYLRPGMPPRQAATALAGAQ
jgi:hypothetical protein